jgi:endonuclease YncB( thermonuclease family)
VLRAIPLALLLPVALLAEPRVGVTQSSCVVERVIDGDTFVCEGGPHVRLLQINAPELGTCGGEWAGAGLRNIFLRPGTQVRLDYDGVRVDGYGRELAAAIVTGDDTVEYNISIVMVYVGLARWAYYSDNAKYLDLAKAAQDWAKTAQWNMWAPGGPFNGATNCG